MAALVPLCLLAANDPPPAAPGPGDIIAAAPAEHWVKIAAADLLVMQLAPDSQGKSRRVVIQLMPAPFSTGWVENIRKLAASHWWDGTAVVRVQDNYVVQWGDPDGEDAEKAKPLPAGVVPVPEAQYTHQRSLPRPRAMDPLFIPPNDIDRWTSFYQGFPVAGSGTPDSEANWPVHCYGMVGVGRNLSPDTGSGAELYVVIGHAPRHLDRNIALVGRVVEGIEHLSSLPRGTGPLGFYEAPGERTVIQSVRLATDLPQAEQPRLEYLSSDSPSFLAYANARANRRDAFFNIPAGGADICNIPVPIRKNA
ncbi:peptidylprolyl isomerase [Blastomonas sp. AAP53]|uniref:peptidylprolyl isomerase n=1 Tax=Blastomonas sp. AAP53 TaxID=1248760 RepID=UPI00031C4116|nr:peptidylprolyl isomerase [Blastomonas sp. AAP53]